MTVASGSHSDREPTYRLRQKWSQPQRSVTLLAHEPLVQDFGCGVRRVPDDLHPRSSVQVDTDLVVSARRSDETMGRMDATDRWAGLERPIPVSSQCCGNREESAEAAGDRCVKSAVR